LNEHDFNLAEFQGNFDWGESWMSFEQFESALYNLKDKSNDLLTLMRDICEADNKYAKRMRSIASGHLKSYGKESS
jgi:hypothetical protein